MKSPIKLLCSFLEKVFWSIVYLFIAVVAVPLIYITLWILCGIAFIVLLFVKISKDSQTQT